jgi:hypothetical protein
VEECLPSRHEALRLNPRLRKRTKIRRKTTRTRTRNKSPEIKDKETLLKTSQILKIR